MDDSKIDTAVAQDTVAPVQDAATADASPSATATEATAEDTAGATAIPQDAEKRQALMDKIRDAVGAAVGVLNDDARRCRALSMATECCPQDGEAAHVTIARAQAFEDYLAGQPKRAEGDA